MDCFVQRSRTRHRPQEYNTSLYNHIYLRFETLQKFAFRGPMIHMEQKSSDLQDARTFNVQHRSTVDSIAT